MEEHASQLGTLPYTVDVLGRLIDAHGRLVDDQGRLLRPDEVDNVGTKPRSMAARLGVLGSLGLLALKFGKFLLIPLKFLKFGKFAGTFISMGLTIWLMAVAFGWWFGLGFVLLLFVHELGHSIMVRRYGLGSGAPVFIPFVGAFVALKKHPPDALTEAKVGIAGPIVGGLGGLATLGIYLATEQPIFLALAYTAFFLNLFNLVPIHPLDGGRTMAAISRKVRLWGMLLLVPAFFLIKSPILILIAVFGLMSLWSERKHPPEKRDRYYEVAPAHRLAMAGAYFATVGLLAYAGWWSYQHLQGLGITA